MRFGGVAWLEVRTAFLLLASINHPDIRRPVVTEPGAVKPALLLSTLPPERVAIEIDRD